ncbi:transposase zinc-binding domain-containing protein [Providencia rettgeri]|nr:transposase zinc-binding domain-containing protein [Providencia rettgeri]MCG9528938.1 transposase zinc-binding domain-containing protein [Providencia rettgeri]
MVVRRYCCLSPECTYSRFFCQTCKSKACSACCIKSTEQWIAQQRHILPDCEWQHIHHQRLTYQQPWPRNLQMSQKKQ